MSRLTASRPRRASISIAAAATTEIVPALANHRIVVLNLAVSIASGNTVVWKSATTALSGAIGPSGYSIGDNEAGVLETAVGQALNITTIAAGVVAGHLTYVYMPTIPDAT